MHLSIRRALILALGLLQITIMCGASCAAQEDNSRKISELIQASTGPDKQKNETALLKLAATSAKTDGEFSVLVNAAHHVDSQVRQAALTGLVTVSSDSIKLKARYVALLDDKSEEVQRVGARVCEKLRLYEAIPKLRGVLATKPRFHFKKYDLGGVTPGHIGIVQAAAEALAKMGDHDSMDDILSRDEVMAIDGFGGPLVATYGAKILSKVVDIAHKNDARKGGAIQAISHLEDLAAIPDLLTLTKDADPQVAGAALATLTKLAKASPEHAQELEAAYTNQLKNADRLIRGQAYMGLLSLDRNKYLPAVLDAIKKDRRVRYELLEELVRYPASEAVPFLREFIKEDEVRNPNSTLNRILAARAIYKATGEKVRYKGIEKDKRYHPDPYVP